MGSIRSTFVRVNSDPTYRARFLKDLVSTLEKEGSRLTTKEGEDLTKLVRTLGKHLTKLGELPRGYDARIDEVEGKPSRREGGDPGPLII